MHLGTSRGSDKRNNPFAPPLPTRAYPYKFRLKRAWDYTYLAHQIQSFLKQRGTALFLAQPKIIILGLFINFERKSDGMRKKNQTFFSQGSSAPFNPQNSI